MILISSSTLSKLLTPLEYAFDGNLLTFQEADEFDVIFYFAENTNIDDYLETKVEIEDPCLAAEMVNDASCQS